MTTKDEALKLALEALEEIESYYGYDRSVGAMASSMYEASNLAKITSTRIREALAEQPPRHRHISYVCPQCHWTLNEQPAISAGMTLRDCFAAKALPSILNPNPVTGQYALVTDFDDCAITAYKMADSMLKARAA